MKDVHQIELHINFSNTYFNYSIVERDNDMTTESGYETGKHLTQSEIDDQLGAIHSKIRETVKSMVREVHVK